MKKIVSISFIVLAITSVFASTVFAAPAGKSVSLVSVDYQPGGIVFLFQTSGLTKSDIENKSFYANTNDQNINLGMHCNFVPDTTIVRCTVSKRLAGMGNFHGTLAGFGFSGELPQARSFDNPTTTLSCSNGDVLWNSIDQFQYGSWIYSFKQTASSWELFVTNPAAIAYNAQNGWTFKITGTFCAPELVFPPMPI